MFLKLVYKLNYIVIAVVITVVLVASGVYTVAVQQANATASATVLPVVMYHHILKSKQGDYIISPDQFEQDLKYIKENGYTTVTTADILAFVEDGVDLPEKPIYITFDDGFEAVYTYAMPLLKQYNMKAVISVIGKHTDIFSDPTETKHLNYSHLSWSQLREMQASAVFEIGNHTYDMHDNCGGKRYGIRKRDGESQCEYVDYLQNDIGALSKQIEHEIGTAPVVFAYPFGALCRDSKQALNDMGFKVLLTCEEKVNKIEIGAKTPISLRRFNRAAKYSTTDFFKRLT